MGILKDFESFSIDISHKKSSLEEMSDDELTVCIKDAKCLTKEMVKIFDMFK